MLGASRSSARAANLGSSPFPTCWRTCFASTWMTCGPVSQSPRTCSPTPGATGASAVVTGLGRCTIWWWRPGLRRAWPVGTLLTGGVTATPRASSAGARTSTSSSASWAIPTSHDHEVPAPVGRGSHRGHRQGVPGKLSPAIPRWWSASLGTCDSSSVLRQGRSRSMRLVSFTSVGLTCGRRSRESGAYNTGLALRTSGGLVVPAVRDSPVAFGTGGIRSCCGVQWCLTGMTPLVPKPVILRVVRSIERVKKGLETLIAGLCGRSCTAISATLLRSGRGTLSRAQGGGHPRRPAPDGPLQHRDHKPLYASLRHGPPRRCRPGLSCDLRVSGYSVVRISGYMPSHSSSALR